MDQTDSLYSTLARLKEENREANISAGAMQRLERSAGVERRPVHVDRWAEEEAWQLAGAGHAGPALDTALQLRTGSLYVQNLSVLCSFIKVVKSVVFASLTPPPRMLVTGLVLPLCIVLAYFTTVLYRAYRARLHKHMDSEFGHSHLHQVIISTANSGSLDHFQMDYLGAACTFHP